MMNKDEAIQYEKLKKLFSIVGLDKCDAERLAYHAAKDTDRFKAAIKEISKLIIVD